MNTGGDAHHGECTTQIHLLSFERGPGRGRLCSGLRLKCKWLHHLGLLRSNRGSPDGESQHTHVSLLSNSMLWCAENYFPFGLAAHLLGPGGD